MTVDTGSIKVETLASVFPLDRLVAVDTGTLDKAIGAVQVDMVLQLPSLDLSSTALFMLRTLDHKLVEDVGQNLIHCSLSRKS